jgi:hypothetical protein
MKTESFKSISESVKRIMLGEAPAAKAPEVDIDALTADAAPAADASQQNVELEVPAEAEAPEEAPEAPEAEAPKKGKGKPKFAAVCNKDGEEAVLLLSKDDLEEFIHENGVKCITALYELGKEAKIPTVKVKA